MKPSFSGPLHCATRPGTITVADERYEWDRRRRVLERLTCKTCGTSLHCLESRKYGYCRACMPRCTACGKSLSGTRRIINGMHYACYHAVYRAKKLQEGGEK